MCELVGDGRRLGLPEPRRRPIGIEKEQYVAERQEPRIFHRTRGEVRYGDEVELGERVGDAEVLAEFRDEGGGGLERGACELRVVLRRHDADREGGRLSFGDVEGSHGEGDEVARQGRCGLEAVIHQAVGPNLARALLCVGEGHRRPRRGDRDVVRRLEAGLVEARERPAGVGRLELRVRVEGAPLAHAVEAGQIRRERCVVGDLEQGAAGREGPRERHHQLFGLDAPARHPRRRGRGYLEASGVCEGAEDVHPPRVQDDVPGRLRGIHLDRRDAGEARLRRVDDEL